ncbi:hypothetical protein AURDEDRAFT_173343 [Auricularia subglabra TFB-10046 SS5]|nr:hypothetical protein AURDEDRAFT_173343 [Auricularia subglabra TFB-10046 SS5]
MPFRVENNAPIESPSLTVSPKQRRKDAIISRRWKRRPRSTGHTAKAAGVLRSSNENANGDVDIAT